MVGHSARRVAVVGSAKTAGRYAEHLRRHCHVETRSVEALGFAVDARAVAEAAELILAAQRVPAARAPAPEPEPEPEPGHQAPPPPNTAAQPPARLRLIVTSAVAARALHKALEGAIRAGGGAFDPRRTEVLTLRGCGTAAACSACPTLANISFFGSRLRDIFAHLEAQAATGGVADPWARTLLLGVATGGDRSYRDSPVLRDAIEELPLYDSAETEEAVAQVRDALDWAGPAGDVVVTSSKSARILAKALKGEGKRSAAEADADAAGLRVVAQGPSTAAALQSALEASEQPQRLRVGKIVTPAAPSIEAITEALEQPRAAPAAVPEARDPQSPLFVWMALQEKAAVPRTEAVGRSA